METKPQPLPEENSLEWSRGYNEAYKLVMELESELAALKSNTSKGGMKWVKASERLPEKRKKLALKDEGDYTSGFLREEGFWITQYGSTRDHSKIEWLDETLQPSGQVWPTEEEKKKMQDDFFYSEAPYEGTIWGNGFDTAIQWLKQRLK